MEISESLDYGPDYTSILKPLDLFVQTALDLGLIAGNPSFQGISVGKNCLNFNFSSAASISFSTKNFPDNNKAFVNAFIKIAEENKIDPVWAIRDLFNTLRKSVANERDSGDLIGPLFECEHIWTKHIRTLMLFPMVVQTNSDLLYGTVYDKKMGDYIDSTEFELAFKAGVQDNIRNKINLRYPEISLKKMAIMDDATLLKILFIRDTIEACLHDIKSGKYERAVSRLEDKTTERLIDHILDVSFFLPPQPITQETLDEAYPLIARSSMYMREAKSIELMAAVTSYPSRLESEKPFFDQLKQFIAIVHLEEWIHLYQETINKIITKNYTKLISAIENLSVQGKEINISDLDEYDVACFLAEQGLELPAAWLRFYSRNKVLEVFNSSS